MSITVRGLVVELTEAAGSVDDRSDLVTRRFAEKVADGQRALAPVGATGDTRNTIGVERGDEGGWLAGTGTWYAHFVEGGTSRLAPRPFIGPPADQHADAYAEAILEVGAEF